MSKLRLEDIPIDSAYNMLYKKNPNEHDIGLIVRSIDKHGYRLPAAFDESLGGIAAGNGRIIALYQMWRSGDYKPPQGIDVDDDGIWQIPILFGVNAANYALALAFLIDANNTAHFGGDGITAIDVMRNWGPDYIPTLEEPGVFEHVQSLDNDDLVLMKQLAEAVLPDDDGDLDHDDIGEMYWVRFQVLHADEKKAIETAIKDIPLDERGQHILDLL